MSRQTTPEPPTPLELARKAYSAHFATCHECKHAPGGICEVARPLIKAVLELTGVGRK